MRLWFMLMRLFYPFVWLLRYMWSALKMLSRNNRGQSLSPYRILLLLRAPVIIFLIILHLSILFDDNLCQWAEVIIRKPFTFPSNKHHYVNSIPEHIHTINDLVGDRDSVYDNLKSFPIPVTVHYVWCGGNFQYQHYLSVLSSYKILRPSRIQFHQTGTPSLDAQAYYQFYGDMIRDVPVIEFKTISRNVCSSKSDKIYYIANVMDSDGGGIFLSINTILSNQLTAFRNSKISHSLNGKLDGIFMMSGNVLTSLKHSKKDELIIELQTNVKASFKCVSDKDYKMTDDIYCVTLEYALFPTNTFTDHSDFGKLARWIGYGTKEPLLLKPRSENVIPKIVHYIWFGNNKLNYFGYLSLLSCLHILKADAVYVHGDYEPRGENWERIKSHPKIHYVYREYPDTVFGNDLHAFLSHGSDILRMDLLLRYGGIYMDWDVLWINEIPSRLFKYDFVGCFDWPETKPFPEVFNYGVLMSMPGSEYAQFSLESYRHFLDKDWSYSPIHMPYKVYESNPQKIHIDRHLQVICAQGNCHPVWLPGYEKNGNHHKTTLKFNWRNETYSMHWTYPDPDEFKDEATLKKSKGMFADIGKFVLQKSGQL